MNKKNLYKWNDGMDGIIVFMLAHLLINKQTEQVEKGE